MSITALYTGVILVIGQFLKSFFSGNIQLLIYSEIPYPEKLITILNAIPIVRSESNLLR